MNNSAFFSDEELKCKCGKCGSPNINPDFLEKLDSARSLSKTPYVITSAYRCKAHNKAIGGTENSLHTKGEAVDIVANTDNKRANVLISLVQAGFTHIGIANDFIHVDLSKKVGIWLYK